MIKRIPRAQQGTADLAVFIGRFQPLHNGHLSVIRRALTEARFVCIVIGSASGPRSHRNPFLFEERREMIEACLTPEERTRITTIRVSDHAYSDEDWIEAVQRAVSLYANVVAGDKADIALIGHSKDSTSYYLSMFPGWRSIEADNHGNISSTPMRESFFVKGGDWLDNGAQAIMPKPVVDWLRFFSKSPTFTELVTEFNFIRDYRKQWGAGPFVTVDAVVVQSGNVLMIRRGGRPGKGLLALPGGFLDMGKNETLRDAMIRELMEETQIKLGDGRDEVVKRILRGSVKHAEAFDEPFRDPRARIITHAFLVALEARPELPWVKGGDDAAEARWMPLSEIREEDCFGDHFHILGRMRGFLPKPKSVG